MNQLDKKNQYEENSPQPIGEGTLTELGSNVKDDEHPLNEADLLGSGRDTEHT